MKTAVRILGTTVLWALLWGLLGGSITFVGVAIGALDAGHVTDIVPVLSGFLAAVCGLVAGGAYTLVAERAAAGIKGRAALGAITGASSVLLLGLIFAVLDKEPSLPEKVRGLIGFVAIGGSLAAALGGALGTLNRPSHLLISAVLLLIIIIGVISGIYVYYHHGRAVRIVWNGVEFRLPPPWFRQGGRPEMDGSVTFSRYQFPGTEHVPSKIILKPASSDFAQNSPNGLRRWEQLKNSMWSFPSQYPKVTNFYYSNASAAKNEFRCANAVLEMGSEELMEIDCIETRSGWFFDYEGIQENASEAMSILRQRR